MWDRENKRYFPEPTAYEIVLTTDGFVFGTDEVKLFEGDRPKGRMCNGCASVLRTTRETIEVG